MPLGLGPLLELLLEPPLLELLLELLLLELLLLEPPLLELLLELLLLLEPPPPFPLPLVPGSLAQATRPKAPAINIANIEFVQIFEFMVHPLGKVCAVNNSGRLNGKTSYISRIDRVHQPH
jgi:hypothetical protein